MKKISAIVTTKNEEHNIVNALKSVSFADEIIVVDSFSTDKTVELAKPIATKIFQRKYDSPSKQKNWAMQKVKFEWIIILDADERVTLKLQEEIKKILKNQSGFDGFWIKRENYFMNKKVKFSGWQGDKVIRLIKKDKCKYNNKKVHEEIIDNGNIGELKNKLIHNTFNNKKDYLKKIERYAKWQAEDYQKKTGKITLFHTVLKPTFRFIKHYFIQMGILDGYVGFTISIKSCFSQIQILKITSWKKKLLIQSKY